MIAYSPRFQTLRPATPKRRIDRSQNWTSTPTFLCLQAFKIGLFSAKSSYIVPFQNLVMFQKKKKKKSFHVLLVEVRATVKAIQRRDHLAGVDGVRRRQAGRVIHPWTRAAQGPFQRCIWISHKINKRRAGEFYIWRSWSCRRIEWRPNGWRAWESSP